MEPSPNGSLSQQSDPQAGLPPPTVLRGWEEACRICGVRSGPTINIFGEEGRRKQLLVKLRFCFSKQVLNVTSDDGLPKVICIPCQKALANSYMNARKIHHVQVYIKEKISVGSNSNANNVTDPKSSHMSCSSSDESDTEQETRCTAAAATTGQVINNPTSQPKNTTVTTVTVTPPLISVSQPQMTTIRQSQIPQPLSQPAAPLSQAQMPLGKVAVPPTQSQMASSGLTQQPQISSLVPSNLPLNQGGMSSLTQQPQVLNIQSQVPITQTQHSQPSTIHQPLLSMGPLPVTQSSSVPSTSVKVEDDSIESVLQDLFAHEPKKPKIEEMAASSNTQVANQIAQLGGNPPITIKTEMGQFPTTGVAATTTKQESFKLPDLFFSSQENKPIHLTQSVEPGRKNAELLTPPINLNPRPSILPLNLPNIILPKEPTRDLPTTMITTQVRPKIVWNEQVAEPTPPPCTVVTKPVTTVTPSTTQGPSALSHLKEYRINRTPSKHGSTGLPSFTEPDDPSKPVSLISQGGGHFKCSRCNVGFKDIAISDAMNPMGSPGDPGKTNNNNSVVVKHCLNVHGTKAMLFRCPVCVNSFPTTVQVEDHLKLHSFSENAKEDNKDDRSEAGDTGPGTFSVDIQCTMCKKDFFDKHALRIHMQAVHFATGALLHDCSTCGRVFTSKTTLKRHAMTHNATNVAGTTASVATSKSSSSTGSNHGCTLCSASFSQKSGLSNHMRIAHAKTPSDNKRVSAQQGSEVSAAQLTPGKDQARTLMTANDIRVNMRLPTSTDPSFLCSGCGLSFKQRQSLNVHMQNCCMGSNDLIDSSARKK